MNLKNSKGETPLHTALDMENVAKEGKELIQLLLANGATPSVHTHDDRTFLHVGLYVFSFSRIVQPVCMSIHTCVLVCFSHLLSHALATRAHLDSGLGR